MDALRDVTLPTPYPSQLYHFLLKQEQNDAALYSTDPLFFTTLSLLTHRPAFLLYFVLHNFTTVFFAGDKMAPLRYEFLGSFVIRTINCNAGLLYLFSARVFSGVKVPGCIIMWVRWRRRRRRIGREFTGHRVLS